MVVICISRWLVFSVFVLLWLWSLVMCEVIGLFECIRVVFGVFLMICLVIGWGFLVFLVMSCIVSGGVRLVGSFIGVLVCVLCC